MEDGMETNSYWLKQYADAKLEEARADGARDMLLASIRTPAPDLLAVVGGALIRIGRRLRRRPGARRPARLSAPGLP
jgi:hypothetical protein